MFGRWMLIGLVAGAVFAAVPASARSEASSLSFISGTSEAAGAKVIDLRDPESCAEASLPGARCLPADYFGTGDNPIGFPALRWLLGTVGLDGSETVVIIGAAKRDVEHVGGLIFQAGQQRVQMVADPFSAGINGEPGEARALTREVVFTAAMRLLD